MNAASAEAATEFITKLDDEIANAPAANYEEDDYNAGYLAALSRVKELVCWELYGCDGSDCEHIHNEDVGGLYRGRIWQRGEVTNIPRDVVVKDRNGCTWRWGQSSNCWLMEGLMTMFVIGPNPYDAPFTEMLGVNA
jgi:hypothetical protein